MKPYHKPKKYTKYLSTVETVLASQSRNSSFCHRSGAFRWLNTVSWAATEQVKTGAAAGGGARWSRAPRRAEKSSGPSPGAGFREQDDGQRRKRCEQKNKFGSKRVSSRVYDLAEWKWLRIYGGPDCGTGCSPAPRRTPVSTHTHTLLTTHSQRVREATG